MRLNFSTKHSGNTTWRCTAMNGCREQSVKVYVDKGVMWPYCEMCAQYDANEYGVDPSKFITVEEAKLLLIKERL